jgi:hypothetical protein
METTNTHLSDDRIAAFRARTLRAEELIDVSRHLQTCAECRMRMEQPAATAAAARMLRADLAARSVSPHLDFETSLLPYVESTLGDDARAAADAHLAECATCRAEIEDLRGFGREVAAWSPQSRQRRVHNGWWAALAAAAVIAVVLFLTRSPAPERPGTMPQPIAVTRPATMVVVLRDGQRQVGLDANGALHGTAVEGQWAALVTGALRNPDLATPASLHALEASRDAQRGSSQASGLALDEPVGSVVESDRPRFRWHGSDELAHFDVAVFDGPGRVLARGATAEREWQPPTPLPRGATYAWQVRAKKKSEEIVAPAPDEPEARFGVLGADVVDAIASARARGEGHLVVGLLYFHGGAIAEAHKEFAQLAAENPRSEIARRLLASAKT